jgi:aryl-alcohol dehydrogenase-like predicted oxidoreductase
MKVVALLESMAAARSITPAQLALAWLLKRGDHVVPIPGTKHRALLEQNCAAVDVELTADDVARIAAVAKPGTFAGARYADMSSVNA